MTEEILNEYINSEKIRLKDSDSIHRICKEEYNETNKKIMNSKRELDELKKQFEYLKVRKCNKGKEIKFYIDIQEKRLRNLIINDRKQKYLKKNASYITKVLSLLWDNLLEYFPIEEYGLPAQLMMLIWINMVATNNLSFNLANVGLKKDITEVMLVNLDKRIELRPYMYTEKDPYNLKLKSNIELLEAKLNLAYKRIDELENILSKNNISFNKFRIAGSILAKSLM